MFKNTHRLKVKDWKKDALCKWKRQEVAVLASDEIEQGGYYITMKRSICQKT